MEYLEVNGLVSFELVESINANDTGIMMIYVNSDFKQEDKDKFARLVNDKTNYSVVYVFTDY